MFARAPDSLAPDGSTGKPLGRCGGFIERRRGPAGYATDDIFYLEVCIFHQICKNGEELFELNAGDEFTCDYDEEAFFELSRLMTDEWGTGDGAWTCR